MSSEESERRGRRRVRAKKMVFTKNKETAVKYGSLIVLVVQNASQVLFMRYVRTRPQEMFLSTVGVFFNEVFKLLTCFLLVCAKEQGLVRCFQVMYRDIICQKLDTLKVCVPAIIYVIQNNLLYVAISNLPAATFMVTYQLKILTTAMFTVLILRRRISIMQWVALVFLFVGVALVQLDEQQAKEGEKLAKAALDLENVTESSNFTVATLAPIKHAQSPIKGFIAVFVACLLSGFAGIYFEKMLKNSEVSVWIRNVQLAIISLPVGLINVFLQDFSKVFDRGFLVGFDLMVWAMICLQSFGGLTVAVVIKYADNILKAFASSVAIILACVASAIIFNFRPTVVFVIGTVLVIIAVFLYGSFPYKKKYHQAPTEPPQQLEKMESAPL